MKINRFQDSYDPRAQLTEAFKKTQTFITDLFR